MPRVLLIDDDDIVRGTVRRMLTLSGFEVEEARDGNAGLESYRACPADLVLCDMFMPIMDGIEVIGKLHREFPGVRVVAMSGGTCGGRIDALQMAQGLGAIAAIASIAKPFLRADLVQVVNAALSGREPA